MKKILVPIDGSETSKKALFESKRLAKVFNSKVVILTVVQDIVLNPYMTEQYYNTQTNENLVKAGEAILKDAVKFFEDYNGEVETQLMTGNSGNTIINEVENENYDLVIMGSRGLGAFSRLMIGSVSNKVLNHVKTNVLIVK